MSTASTNPDEKSASTSPPPKPDETKIDGNNSETCAMEPSDKKTPSFSLLKKDNPTFEEIVDNWPKQAFIITDQAN